VIVPEGKNNWGWCSFVEVLQFLLSPYSLVKQTPLGVKTDDLPSLKLQDAQGVRTYAQVVRETTINGKDTGGTSGGAQRKEQPLRVVQRANTRTL